MALRAMSFSGFRNRWMTTKFDGILSILDWGAPVEVFQTVVMRIVVAVTAEHSLGSGSDEGFQDECVDRYLIRSRASIQGAAVVWAHS